MSHVSCNSSVIHNLRVKLIVPKNFTKDYFTLLESTNQEVVQDE